MRIAIAYDSLFPVNSGGGERVYRRIAELMIERGHHVDYLTRRQWDVGSEPAATFRVIPVWEGDIYHANGARMTSSAVKFAIGLFKYLRRSRGDYDLVVASALPVLTLLASWVALFGSKSFLVADWLEFWGARKWRAYAGVVSGTIAAALQRLAVHAARLHTANSRFTAQRIQDAGGSPPIVLGLVDLVSAPRRPQPPVEPPYMLFVGRLIPDKRATALPAALQQARKAIPDLTLKVVGTGPERDAVIDMAVFLGVSANVNIVGRVDDEALTALLSGAAVLVNPSAREGFGLIVAEAAALGVPSVVVLGEDNAAVDLIDSGVNGFVASSVDPAELGDAIVAAIDGGPGLRRTTREWFDAARVSSGLEASVDAILEYYTSAR